MALVETEGLILKSYTLSEADKIVFAFTRRRGMIKAVARSAGKLKSRFSGQLEPFTQADLVYYEKEDRELVSIRQIELRHSNFYLAGNPSAFITQSYFAELLLEFVPPHEPNEILYRLARTVFPAVSDNHEENKLIILYFEIWLLKLSGYLADWQICAECRKTIASHESSLFDSSFRFYCLNCKRGKESLLSGRERRILNLTHQLAPLEFAKTLREEEPLSEVLSNLTRRIIRRTLEREPKIWSYTF